MLNIRKFLKAIGLVGNSSSTITAAGEVEFRSDLGKLSVHDGSSADQVVVEAKAATLTTKTINAPDNTITNIRNAEISATAAIVDTKLATIATAGKVSNSATTATDANTNSAIVARDASGNFTAGTITAALSGNATTATTAGNVSGVVAADHGGTGVANNVAATLTRSGNHGVTLTTTGTTSVTLPTAGTLSTLAGTESLSNKTFSDAVTGAQISTPSNPSSGFDKLYFKNDDKLYTLNSSGVETAIGAGSGGINYITNPDAESATTGWATYANSAANIPSTGTGGTATGLTFSRSTSSPLRGAASFSLVQANSTSLQGKGVSYDFTINSADQARMLSISFDYNASSTFVASNGTTAPLNDGTTTTNAGNSDLEVFIYDVTNAKLIPVSPQVLTANGTNNYQYVGEFQTSSNSTSYRLIFHVATTSANATGWTVKYDNVSVGPQTKLLGPPITDWTSYIPASTQGFGIIASPSIIYRRVGDSVEVKATFTTGTTNASGAQFSLPNNLTIDSTKMSSSIDQKVGKWARNQGGATTNKQGVVTTRGGYTYVEFSIDDYTTASSPLTGSRGGSTLFSSSEIVSFDFVVPIAGWSSTTTMSNDTDTRVVAMSATTTTISSGGANTPIVFGTTQFDTHAGYNASTGRYTVPVSGKYRVSTSGLQNNHPGSVYVWKNGAQAILLDVAVTSSDGFAPFSGSGTLNLVAGDIIDVRLSITIAVGDAGSLSIERLSGPATIAAASVVAALYTGGTATIDNTFNNSISFTTKVTDTHNSYSGTTYTVPVSGYYDVTASVEIDGTYANGNSGQLSLYINGVQKYLNIEPAYGTGTGATYPNLNVKAIPLLAGDAVVIRIRGSATSPTLNSSGLITYFGISRLGGVI